MNDKDTGKNKGLRSSWDKESAQTCYRALSNEFSRVVTASFGSEDGRAAE